MKSLCDDIVFGTLPGAMLHDMELHRNYNAGLGQSSQIEGSLSCTVEKVGYNSKIIIANRGPICTQTVRRQLLTTSRSLSLLPAFSVAQESLRSLAVIAGRPQLLDRNNQYCKPRVVEAVRWCARPLYVIRCKHGLVLVRNTNCQRERMAQHV